MENRIPSVILRLASMFIDHIIMTFAIGISSLILSLPLLLFKNKTKLNDSLTLIGVLVVIIGFILFSIYFNKDILNGRSPAKRIFKLQVIDNETELTASPMKCLIRNLTAVIFPLEIIMILINPSQRLGDMLVNTKVVLFDEFKEKEPLNKKEILKVLVIGIFAFIGLFSLSSLFQIFTN